jgi:WD40 repeat protein
MKLIDTLRGHNGCINALTGFTYFDSNYLISGSSDSRIKIWNQTSNQELETKHNESIQALAYENRLHYLAIGSKDKTFSLWKRTDEYKGIVLNTKITDV